MRSLAALVLLVVLAGCTEQGPRPAAPGPSVVRSDEHRFTYELPAGWERAAHPLTPGLLNPVEILAAGTVADMRAREGECAHMPVGAIERMETDDVFVSVMERYGEMSSPPRPARFTLPVTQEQSDATECARGEPPLDVYWFDFSDARRWFYVLVALGRDAPPERRVDALALLDSLRFEPGPEGVHLDPNVTMPMHDAALRLSWQQPQPPWRHYDWPQTSVEEPRERLVLGTFALERRPPDDNCTPRTAIDALPPDGALIYLLEYTESRSAGFPEAGGGREFGPERNYECLGPSRMARWRQGGRAFQAHLILGPRASEELLDEARSIVNSITIR
jgi:hypothetical protein